LNELSVFFRGNEEDRDFSEIPIFLPWKEEKGIMLKKIRHIGIMGEEFERTVERFKGFGLPCTEVKEVKEIGAKIAFFPIGDTLIEFICHTGPGKEGDTVTRLVREQKGTINHLCFEVDNLEKTIKDFEKNGAKLVEGCPRPGAHGRIAFFHPETTEGVLIELCEV
jgi:methylmalonyl-CoA/ethylmalonyl-CoA epimerase